MSRDSIIDGIKHQAIGLVRAWWCDDRGQASLEYAMFSVAGMLAAYQAADTVGHQITNTFGQISHALDRVNRARF